MTPTSQIVEPQQLVSEVLGRWPAACAVFVRRGMACPGCSMAPFMSLAEAANAYAIPPDALIKDLEAAISGATVGFP